MGSSLDRPEKRVVLRYLPPRDAQVGSASAELILSFLSVGGMVCVSEVDSGPSQSTAVTHTTSALDLHECC